jgi:hypothetical protein
MTRRNVKCEDDRRPFSDIHFDLRLIEFQIRRSPGEMKRAGSCYV